MLSLRSASIMRNPCNLSVRLCGRSVRARSGPSACVSAALVVIPHPTPLNSCVASLHTIASHYSVSLVSVHLILIKVSRPESLYGDSSSRSEHHLKESEISRTREKISGVQMKRHPFSECLYLIVRGQKASSSSSGPGLLRRARLTFL